MRSLFLMMLSCSVAACGDSSGENPVGSDHGGTVIGNALTSLRLELISSLSSQDLVASDSGGATIYVDAAQGRAQSIGLWLEDARCNELEALRPPSQCMMEGERSWVGVYHGYDLDLVAATSSPALEDLEMPPRTYQQGFSAFVPSQSGETLVLEGRITYATLERAFQVTIGVPLTASFTAGELLHVPANKRSRIRMVMDTAHWFSGVSLVQCLLTESMTLSGEVLVLRIGPQSCGGEGETLISNVASSGRLYLESLAP